MILHLDNTLHRLLTTHVPGITQSSQVRFQPPNAEWRTHVGSLGELLGLNVYLVDLRENRTLRSNQRIRTYTNGIVRDDPAPPRVDCHYLISAWSPAAVTQQVDPTPDEHQLIYDVVTALFDFCPLVAAEVYGPQAPVPAWPAEYQRFFRSALPTVVLPAEGFPKLAEFWGTMGQPQPWRPAAYIIITVPVLPRRPAFEGPPVTTIHTDIGALGGTADALYIIAGEVRDATNVAVPRAWLRLETPTGTTLFTGTTDEAGRFRLAGLAAGEYVLRYAAATHAERTQAVTVPASTGEYTLRFL